MARQTDPNKRERILAAARKVFLMKGYERAHMSAIAAEADLAVGTLYLYFASKESLLGSVRESFLGRLYEEVVPLLPSISTTEGVERLIDTMLQLTTEEVELLRMGESPESGATLELKQEFVSLVGHNLEEQMNQGKLRYYDPPVLANLLVSLIQQAIGECLVWGNQDISRYRKVLVLIFERLLLN